MANIDYTELSYKELYLNPMVIPLKKSPYDYYPVWKQFPEFLPENFPHLSNTFLNKLLRYIPLVYGQKSPLHTVLTDIKKIKGVAADLAGFKKSAEWEYPKELEQIFLCRDREVNKMIIRYVTLHKQAKYTEQCILREAHFKLSAKIVEDPTPKDLANFREVGSQLDELTSQIFGGDTNEKLQADLSEYYMEDRIMLRPEDIARNKKEGKALL